MSASSQSLECKGVEKRSNPQEEKSGGGFIKSGSIPSASFSMAKATLGAGALTLSQTFYDAGLIIALGLLVVMAYITVVSLQEITRAVNRTGKATYEEIVYHLFGRYWAYAFEVVMILFCFGTCVAYLIAVCDIIEPVMAHFIPNPVRWYELLFANRACFTAILTVVVMLPLSLCRSIQSVRYISFLGVLCVGFLGITAMYVFIRYGLHPSLDDFDKKLAPQGDWTRVVGAIAVYTFAYCGANNVPQLYQELNDRSYEKFSKVAKLSTGISFVTYLMIGIFGYLSFGDETQSLIVNLSDYVTGNPERGLKPDPVVILSISLMCFAVVGAFPLNIFPIRTSIEMFFDTPEHLENKGDVKEEDSKSIISREFRGWIIVSVTILVTYLGAVLVPKLSIVLELVGSLTGSIISFIGPAAFNLALELPEERFSLKNWRLMMLLFVGFVTFVLGTYCSIVAAIAEL